MSLPLSSTEDLYQIFITSLQNVAPDLTDTLEGSIIDALASAFAVAGSEVQRNTIINFAKTFFNTANGPEITGGPDDLQTLAVDHFGDSFARPGAIAAIDTAIFSRANNSGGSVLIPKLTVVKTKPDANGNVQRYETQKDVTMTANSSGSDTSVSVSIIAVVAGAAGSAAGGTINTIESTLLDSTITVANVGNATGEDAQDDSAYRETIRNLIEAIAGATLQAVKASALTVPGVASATPVEQLMTVIQYNPANSQTVGTYFNIPKALLYIADSTGTASPALIAAVKAKIKSIKAAGAYITISAASAQTVNWTASITLNPLGPSYSTLVNDASMITDAMASYINTLPTGTSFVRSIANAAMLALYGPSGTNDLTAFTTSIPSGDVSASSSTKFVAGTVGLA